MLQNLLTCCTLFVRNLMKGVGSWLITPSWINAFSRNVGMFWNVRRHPNALKKGNLLLAISNRFFPNFLQLQLCSLRWGFEAVRQQQSSKQENNCGEKMQLMGANFIALRPIPRGNFIIKTTSTHVLRGDLKIPSKLPGRESAAAEVTSKLELS